MTWENIFEIILRKRLRNKTMVCTQGKKARRNYMKVLTSYS